MRAILELLQVQAERPIEEAPSEDGADENHHQPDRHRVLVLRRRALRAHVRVGTNAVELLVQPK